MLIFMKARIITTSIDIFIIRSRGLALTARTPIFAVTRSITSVLIVDIILIIIVFRTISIIPVMSNRLILIIKRKINVAFLLVAHLLCHQVHHHLPLAPSSS